MTDERACPECDLLPRQQRQGEDKANQGYEVARHPRCHHVQWWGNKTADAWRESSVQQRWRFWS